MRVCRFKISKNDHIIDVKPFDDIDFVCPFYSATHGAGAGAGGRRGATALAEAAESHEEQYLIYRVMRQNYIYTQYAYTHTYTHTLNIYYYA